MAHAHGKLSIMGEIKVQEVADYPRTYTYPMALLITFDNAEQIRKAIADGICTFSFGPEES